MCVCVCVCVCVYPNSGYPSGASVRRHFLQARVAGAYHLGVHPRLTPNVGICVDVYIKHKQRVHPSGARVCAVRVRG